MSCSNTSSSSRRVFIARVVAGGTAVITFGAQAQGAPMVDEKDAQASALGYVADTTKADAKKYPKHTADQKCSGCQLYTGKAADKAGPCSLFAGKQVAGNGWCSAWVKKPA
jgi:High potential iron-sulfur protein